MFCPTQFRKRDALTECGRDCTACLPWHYRLRRGASRRSLEAYERSIRRASVVVANSQYVQKVIRRFYGLSAPVMYPTIDLGLYDAAGDPAQREHILFVKPQYVKGFPIFLKIVQQMRDARFLVAGCTSRRTRRQLERLGNVEVMGWTADMRAVYARARVLLGPSIWQEPFGRVFVEAGASGVPSVASARGGIPEAVGEGGILIDDIFDVNRWVWALRELDDPVVYARLSMNAREHARQVAAGAGVERFAEIVKSTIGLAL
jgi:glycosyltransferase involved in cell wall biosynthesis